MSYPILPLIKWGFFMSMYVTELQSVSVSVTDTAGHDVTCS